MRVKKLEVFFVITKNFFVTVNCKMKKKYASIAKKEDDFLNSNVNYFHNLHLGKLMPPLHLGYIQNRENLLLQISRCDKPVSLLMAPAGFGKTILMAQFYINLKKLGRPTAWLSLDHRDNDFSRFFVYFREAIIRLGVDLPSIGIDRNERNSAYSDLLAESFNLIDLIVSSKEDFTLFLDEYENIHSADVITFTSELLKNLGQSQRVVIGSRSMRKMPLASIEASGKMHRLGVSDLMFDIFETNDFLKNQGYEKLSDVSIKMLQNKIDGWPAGLRLVTLTLPKDDDASKWIEDFSVRAESVGDYLAENVLKRLSKDICDFMMDMSILNELSVGVCDAVLESSESFKLIDEIYRSNIFLSLVDVRKRTYIFHSFFRDFLRSELIKSGSEKVKKLHRKAAVYMSSIGNYADAFYHAKQSEDDGLAVDILDMCAMRFVQLGQLDTVSKWISSFDNDITSNSVNIQRARAYASISMHHYDDAQDALCKLGQIAERTGGSLDSEDAMQLALMYEWMDRHDLAEPEVFRSSNIIPVDRYLAYSISRNMMGYLSMLKLDFISAQKYFDSSKKSNNKCGKGSWPDNYTKCFEGILEIVQGNSIGGVGRLEVAISDAAASGISIPSAFYAEALYYKGDMIRAGLISEEYLRLNKQIAPPDIVIISFRTAARVSFYNGNLGQAELLLTELSDIGDLRDIPRLKASAWLEKSRLALLMGDIDTADRYLTLGANSKLWKNQFGYHSYSQEIDDPEIALCRMDLVAGDASDAANRLESLVREAESTGRRWRKIRLQNLLCQAYFRMGRKKQASDLLESAIINSEMNMDVNIFADEPWCLLDVLSDVLLRSKKIDPVYFNSIVEYTTKSSKRISSVYGLKSSSDGLTLKEVAILNLVSKGLSNKEIARVLSITENTVETHLRRVNQKLNSKNRTQAVTFSREKGYLV